MTEEQLLTVARQVLYNNAVQHLPDLLIDREISSYKLSDGRYLLAVTRCNSGSCDISVSHLCEAVDGYTIRANHEILVEIHHPWAFLVVADVHHMSALPGCVHAAVRQLAEEWYDKDSDCGCQDDL